MLQDLPRNSCSNKRKRMNKIRKEKAARKTRKKGPRMPKDKKLSRKN
jgi:hypothetical protein